MNKKKEVFLLILWGILFSCMIFLVEYLFGDSWKDQYMPVRKSMMQRYLDEIQQGIFPQIQKSKNCDHAVGFYILAAFVGNILNFNAEQVFRAFTLFFSISMLIVLMFFIYYYYENFVVAFVVPILGYICFEDYLFRVKNDVYVAIGIWMVVVSVPIFIMLFKTNDIRMHLRYYILLVFIISFSNIAREHTSLGILVCFLISGIKDIYMIRREGKLVKYWLGVILLAGILGYNFCASGLPNMLLQINGQDKWLTASTAWHNIYIGFGYFDNPYNIVYLDECAVAAVRALDGNILYPSNEYFWACKELVFILLQTDFGFCLISLIKKAIWIIGGIGIVTVRRVLRIFIIGIEVIYLFSRRKRYINLYFIKAKIWEIIYIFIIGLTGLIPSILTAPNIIYSITSYAMVELILLFGFIRIIEEKVKKMK